MKGRIIRPETTGAIPGLPEIGRLHIGKKQVGQNGKEYPVSTDYFIPSGKYSSEFTKALGATPSLIQVIFPSDDPSIVCNERYEYRDNSGALVADGDGHSFRVWDGKKYVIYTVEDFPNLMDQITANFQTKRGADNWDIVLSLSFIVPSVRGIIGVWRFTTKGKASSIKNIRESFDSIRIMRGTVTGTVFDLAVTFAKSNKPNTNTRYPVVSMVANDTRIDEIREAMRPKESLSLLLSE